MPPFGRLTNTSMHDSSDNVFSLLPLQLELDASCMPDSLPLKSRQPRVRFQAEVSVINPSSEYYTEEDTEAKWILMGDLQQIKLFAKEQSSKLRKCATGEDNCLILAHRKTSLMLKSDFKSLVKLTPSTPDQDLRQWCSSTDGRRGLERFCSRDFAVMRRNDISNTRNAVIVEYKEQRAHQMVNPEKIAQIAQEASKRARTFARFVAAADAHASKNPEPASRRPLARCKSEMRTPMRCAPPRKRSKQYHREDFFPALSH